MIACGDVAADLISALCTGTNLDIAATDQITPIVTTTAIPIHARICILSLRIELGEIGVDKRLQVYLPNIIVRSF